jgi:alcohol dehydrogenase
VRGVVVEQVGRVAVRDVPAASLEEPDDAIVRVTRSAICGSDLHFVHGKAPIEPTQTIGHEAVGVVEATGPQVRRFSAGRRVVVAFHIACGACWFCLRGQTQLCEDYRGLGAGAFGGGLGGTQAEFVRVPHADVNLLGIPDAVDDEGALFVGDILTTGMYAVSLANVSGANVVVVGAGPLGYFCARAAQVGGAARVVALDREPDRLRLAAASGIEPIDIRERDPEMAIARMTHDRGADVVIEAVGAPPAFESALDVVRRGGTVVVVGMYAGESVELQLGVMWARAVRLVFSGMCPVHSWWERAMAAVAEGRIDPTPVVSHRLPLAEAPLGYELFDAHEASKVVLVP